MFGANAERYYSFLCGELLQPGTRMWPNLTFIRERSVDMADAASGLQGTQTAESVVYEGTRGSSVTRLLSKISGYKELLQETH